MAKIVIRRPAAKGPVKLYAHVPSRTKSGIFHTVTYIRKPGMERWTCTCEYQTFVRNAKRRHCDHIKDVRKLADAA
jgi:hypothetical protein